MAVRVRSHYWWLYTWVLHWAPAISCGVARGMNRYGSGHDRANERPDEMKLLELYLARVLMGQILVVLGVLAGIFAFVTFIDQVSYLGTGNYSVLDALRFVLLSTPRITYEIFPMAVLIGAILGLSLLALDSELIVMRSSGVSIGQITSAVLKLGLLLAFIALLIGEFLTPWTETLAQRGRAQALEQNIEHKSNSGLWMRDGGTFVNVREVLPDLSLRGVRVFQFDNSSQLRALVHAGRGYFSEDFWDLDEVKQTLIDEQGFTTVAKAPKARWTTSVTPQTMSVFLVQPDQLSLMQLRKYIAHLVSNVQDTRNFELAYWSKLNLPFATAVMLLLAIPFVFGSIRTDGMGRNLFIGIMIGIVFFAASKALGYIVLVYRLPPILGATMPTLTFAIAAGLLYRRIP
ncbi:MAG: LPS export ABC transporter permease LptG [Acidiferrobacteraceae bacterium]|nr:LPS export ABC transporter permease LptG [Acidiferrobacteraceae bacterium]